MKKLIVATATTVLATLSTAALAQNIAIVNGKAVPKHAPTR